MYGDSQRELLLLDDTANIFPQDSLVDAVIGLFHRVLARYHDVLLKLGKRALLKHFQRKSFIELAEDLLLRIHELQDLSKFGCLLQLGPPNDALHFTLLQCLSQSADLAHHSLDQQEGQALKVVVVTCLYELLCQMPKEGIGIALMQQQSAVPPYLLCLSCLFLSSRPFPLLLAQLLFSPCGQLPQISRALLYISFVLPTNQCSGVRGCLLRVDDSLHIGIQVFAGRYLMDVCYHSIGLDVELAHIERQFFLFAKQTRSQVLLQTILQKPCGRMSKKICPLDTLGRVYYQHAPYDIFHLRVHFMREDDRVLLDAFQQIDDV